MLDAVNITQATSGVNLSAFRAVAAVQKQPQVEKSSARPVETQVQAAVEQDQPVTDQPISPRIRPDFIAGAVVTEFTNADGQVSQQVPSQAALAYLRAGLTATGENIPSDIEKFVEGGDKSAEANSGQVLVA